MTGTLRLSPLVHKEVRALLPIWFVSAATMSTVWLTSGVEMRVAGALAYALGTTTLGALVIGHEYANGTLSQLLAQPIDRRQVLRVKLSVAAAMIAALALVAGSTLGPLIESGPDTSKELFGSAWTWSIVVLSGICGLTIAPWLTMAFRNPIAGVVFTGAIPVALWAGAEAVDAAIHGWERAAADRTIVLAVLWSGVLAVSALAAMRTSGAFRRLEALDGHELGGLPDLGARSHTPLATHVTRVGRRRRLLPLLVAKELRLLSASLYVALLYIIGHLAVTRSNMPPDIIESLGGGITVLYMTFVPLFVGALASAEERALGTIGWQALQPLAYWKQWMTKVVVAVSVALLLALVLPFVLQQISPNLSIEAVTRLRAGRFLVWPLRFAAGLTKPIAVVLLCVSCGLYISSLCRSGLKALLLTILFVTVAGSLIGNVALWSMTMTSKLLHLQELWEASLQIKVWTAADQSWYRWSGQVYLWLPVLQFAGFVITLLVLAGRNHRSGEHGSTLARRQLLHLTWVAAMTAALVGILPLVDSWFFYSNALQRMR